MCGATLIVCERVRQEVAEGFSEADDDVQDFGELIGAAISYAGEALRLVTDGDLELEDAEGYWPWDEDAYKPADDPIRNLVKAGALIAAEIDRLQRLEAKKGEA